ETVYRRPVAREFRKRASPEDLPRHKVDMMDVAGRERDPRVKVGRSQQHVVDQGAPQIRRVPVKFSEDTLGHFVPARLPRTLCGSDWSEEHVDREGVMTLRSKARVPGARNHHPHDWSRGQLSLTSFIPGALLVFPSRRNNQAPGVSDTRVGE